MFTSISKWVKDALDQVYPNGGSQPIPEPTPPAQSSPVDEEKESIDLRVGDLVRRDQDFSFGIVRLVEEGRTVVEFPTLGLNLEWTSSNNLHRWVKVVGHVDPAPQPEPGWYNVIGRVKPIECLGVAHKIGRDIGENALVVVKIGERLYTVGLDEWVQPVWEEKSFVLPYRPVFEVNPE